MKTYVQLNHTHEFQLPARFQDDDVRFSETLVEYFLREFTQENDVVLDPFAGYGTTLLVAEAMGRIPFGLEFDQERFQYVQARLRLPENLINGDSRRLAEYDLPAFDFSITSPPYMGKHDEEDPLTAYTTKGGGYAAYLRGIQNIYAQVGQLMKPDARVVIEVTNLKTEGGLTRLAWDIGAAVAQVLNFEGETIICWDEQSYGYDHSYCLEYTRPR